MKTELKEKLRAALAEAMHNDAKKIDGYTKGIAAACELSNGMILFINKRPVETKFCFGYSDCGQGPEFSEACESERNARNENTFIWKNSEYFRNLINRVADRDFYPLIGPHYFDFGKNGTNPLRTISFHRLTDYLARLENCEERKYGMTVKDFRGETVYIPTPDDMERIRAMYEEAKEQHEKKVRSYLKRYGTSKVKTWTFWLDE